MRNDPGTEQRTPITDQVRQCIRRNTARQDIKVLWPICHTDHLLISD